MPKFGTVTRLLVFFWISKKLHFCPTSPDIKCICESMKDRQFYYKATCFKQVNKEEIFSMSYYTNKGYFKVQCKTSEPLNDGYFEALMLRNLTLLEFDRCNVPNKSFNYLFQSTHLKTFIFKSHNYIQYLGSNMLNSSLLENLRFSGNGIQNISENTFQTTVKLQNLDLSNNRLQTLPPSLFAYLSNLTYLNLENNQIRTIPDSLFGGLPKLKTLLLSHNKLQKMPANIFSNLVSLQTLKLIRNEIREIHEDMVSRNSELQKLYLSQNHAQWLPNGMLHSASKLQILDISNNPLSILPKELLLGKVSLQVFKSNACNLSSIPPDFFNSTTNLLNISMYNNRLTQLKEGIFTTNKNLKYLDLSFNDIVHFIGSPFNENGNLQVLKLYKNDLQNISKNHFQGLASLKLLDISSNSIKHIAMDAFCDLGSLEILNISNNEIPSIEGIEPFGPSENLKIIDVSSNVLIALPDGWESYMSLKEFWAHNNKIVSFLVPIMISRKTKVYLQSNAITLVNTTLLKKAEQVSYPTSIEDIPMFYLENNPFRCDCHLYEFHKYFSLSYSSTHSVRFYDGHKLKCSSPRNLRGTKIASLTKEKFICNITENCPAPCLCSFQQSNSAVILDCKGKHLNKIPDTILPNISSLNMQSNNLSSLTGLEETIWENLTEIYLDGNLIPTQNWYVPLKLRRLSITKNHLTWLPDSIRNHANTFKEFTMHVANNPWNCNCSLKMWLSQHFKQVSDIGEIYCQKHNENNTDTVFSLMNTSDSILCPIDKWPQKLNLILYITTCIIAATIIITAIALYYRNKRTILAFMYIHFHCVFKCFYQHPDFDDDKLFDAFISYNSNDRDVTFQLIEELENKPPHYKLCIHERDWIPGNLITNNIIDSVKSSKRTILVISKHFLESMWFHIEFHTAYHQMLEDKMDRLIVIVRGELPPITSLDKDLQSLLSTKTYTVWEEKWFWEKLRYAMPYKESTCVPCSIPCQKSEKNTAPLDDKISLIYPCENTVQTQNPMDLTVLNEIS